MKYLSLFSGIGGFEVGIQNSKYQDELECIGFSEVDKYATSIYKRHFPTHTELGDVTKINTNELEDFELLVGGFPCQSFSNAGSKKGFNDTRGTLFFEIARILKDKRPSYFLLENVQGLLWNKNGETFQTIIRILTDLGYNMQWQIYNSQKYGGVPQYRPRLFIKGYIGNKYSPKIHLEKRESRRPNISRVKDKALKIKTTTKKGYKEAYEGDGILIERANHTIRRGMVQSCATGTLNCSNNWGVIENNWIRRLTPLECERLQGFEDNWTEYGVNGEKISDTQRYKVCGNAVTTNVINYIMNNWDLIQ